MLSDCNSLDAYHLLKTPKGVVATDGSFDHGLLINQMPAATHEQLAEILDDDQMLRTDAPLNITKRQPRLQTALRSAGCLMLFIQIVGLEVIDIGAVPLRTLSTMPLPLTLPISTSLLPILEPWVGNKPAFAYPARTFASGAPAHRFLSC